MVKIVERRERARWVKDGMQEAVVVQQNNINILLILLKWREGEEGSSRWKLIKCNSYHVRSIIKRDVYNLTKW